MHISSNWPNARKHFGGILFFLPLAHEKILTWTQHQTIPPTLTALKRAKTAKKLSKNSAKSGICGFLQRSKKNRSIKDLISTRQKLFPEWSTETQEFFDELYSRLEYSETELEVFNLRLKGEWTPNSKLYTKKELDDATNEAYSWGYRDGKENFYGEWKTQT